MRYLFLGSLLVWGLGIFYACQTKRSSKSATTMYAFLTQQIDSTIRHLDTLERYAQNKKALPAMQKKFKEARFQYKHVEGIIEYYFQGLNKRINGAALPDIKTEDGQVLPPHGFQVLEESLFEADAQLDEQAFVNEIRLLKGDLMYAQKNLAYLPLQARQIGQSIQHQIIRVATLGITGFDSPIALLSIEEARHSLIGIQLLYKHFYEDSLHIKTPQRLAYQHQVTIGILAMEKEFDKFDRMAFIKKFLMPLSESYQEISQKFALPADSVFNQQVFTGTLKDLMQGKGFQADVNLPYTMAKSNTHKVTLGEKLFYDKSLSKNAQMSCGSCHSMEKGMADGLEKARNFAHGGKLARNTPTIYYSGLQQAQFYDMRAVYLEDQIEAVMNNADEFNLNSQDLAVKVAQNSAYKDLIAKAFPTEKEFKAYHLRNAIASYVRSLNSFTSRFDKYMQGDSQAMNQVEIAGFNLFTGKAKCATCHFLPLFNGTIPPWFTKTESEVIGVPAEAVWKGAKIDADLGRYGIHKFEELKYAFKTPTLRNAPATAPHMHNGVYKSLEDVVRFYNVGGGKGIGIDLAHQTLPTNALNLTEQEQHDLIAFLHTLEEVKY